MNTECPVLSIIAKVIKTEVSLVSGSNYQFLGNARLQEQHYKNLYRKNILISPTNKWHEKGRERTVRCSRRRKTMANR